MASQDAELIERWQNGDPAAFELLVRRWQQPMGRFLRRLTGEGDLTPDLCQEVFLRAYRAGPRYRQNGAFSTWLYRIAINVARDAARRKRPQTSLRGAEVTDSSPSAEAACERLELKELVVQALAELPEELRLVLVLRHYEQMSFEDIARLTGSPASTLKSRFAAALNRLRVRLEQLGWGPQENET
jgi:RNA polymerase sigma-70 factor, ECF subfamily